MGYQREAKIYEEVSKQETMPEEFVLDVTPEEYEKSGSKFATLGLHLAEMGLPEWETPGQSIRFPFIIVDEGIDNGKVGKLVSGVRKEAMWKIKEIEEATGVTIMTKTLDNKMSLNPEAVVGKQVKILYTKEVDSRTAEEGGTGTRYTKAQSAYPADTTNDSLGI